MALPDDLVAIRHARNLRGTARMDRLSKFYPGVELGPHDVFDGPCDYSFFSREVGYGTLYRPSKARYRLSERGQVQVMCHIMNASFLEMCILAELYVVNTYQAKCGVEPRYPICDITDRLDGIFSKKTIQNVMYRLCSAGLVAGVQRQLFCLEDGAEEMLREHQATIRLFHEMLAELPASIEFSPVCYPSPLYM